MLPSPTIHSLAWGLNTATITSPRSNRYYDPTNARFITRDPIGYLGGMNLYGYVGGNPIGRVDPNGTDMYETLNGWAVSGYQRGGFWGHAQAELSNVGTALIDTIGGQMVKSLATKLGDAAGAGRTAEAWGYGAATIGYIALEAFTWGRTGAMINAPLAGTKAAGTEFSHFIGEATMKKYPFWQTVFGAVKSRTAFNGKVVSVVEHAMTDAYRFRFLKVPVKTALGGVPWGPIRSYINRSPDWLRFLVFRPGANFIGSASTKDNCDQ